MAERTQPGDWVRIHMMILPAGERAPGMPSDTAQQPYEGWINGWAVEAASIGEWMTIRTPAGRQVQGRLVEIAPGHWHSFGRPHAAMLAIGPALRSLLDDGEA